jgi:aspartate aminotransferase
VATVTGDAFGNPNCIRLSYATSEALLTEAFKRIKEALA